jgi:galactokinase
MNFPNFVEQTKALFLRRFGREPLMVRSPGRINLIGEHTDYNQGFVLPGAIDKCIVLAGAPRDDRRFRFFAADLSQPDDGSFDILAPSPLGWPDYLLGIVSQLERIGLSVPGVDLVFGGTIPIGAGLSSSAALETGFLFLLNELYGLNLDKMKMATLAQASESEFVGVQCGIMDQFANLFGRKNSLLQLDCRSMEHAVLPFDFDDTTILLCDSRVRHELASSEYNVRRSQCEQGVAVISNMFPGITSLRDVTMDRLDACSQSMDGTIARRCKYVIEENLRVGMTANALNAGRIDEVGELMIASHEGLRDLYEVSCPELDVLVDAALRIEGVYGSRMMGGGFGGCTISLVREDCVEEFAREMPDAYYDATGKDVNIHRCAIGDGTSRVH